MCFHLSHTRLRVRKTPGIPCALCLLARCLEKSSGRSCRGNADACARKVIASVAKQSNVLRDTLDCFVACAARKGGGLFENCIGSRAFVSRTRCSVALCCRIAYHQARCTAEPGPRSWAPASRRTACPCVKDGSMRFPRGAASGARESVTRLAIHGLRGYISSREAAPRVRSHISPGPYRSFRELSLAGSVDPDIWCPPTFVGNSGIECFNGVRGFALLFLSVGFVSQVLRCIAA